MGGAGGNYDAVWVMLVEYEEFCCCDGRGTEAIYLFARCIENVQDFCVKLIPTIIITISQLLTLRAIDRLESGHDNKSKCGSMTCLIRDYSMEPLAPRPGPNHKRDLSMWNQDLTSD